MARILVVDDEPSAIELLTEFLTAKNHTVIAAVNGEEALRKVKEERPHLIFLDVLMPKMSGIDVLKKIREIDKEVGVIMVTAIHEEEIGPPGAQAGRVRFHHEAHRPRVSGKEPVAQDRPHDPVRSRRSGPSISPQSAQSRTSEKDGHHHEPGEEKEGAPACACRGGQSGQSGVGGRPLGGTRV